MLLTTYKFLSNPKSHFTYSFIGKKDVCETVYMYSHTLSSQHQPCYGGGIPLLNLLPHLGLFSWLSIRSLARDTDDNLSVSLISSWVFFLFVLVFFFFKQLFETTTGILSIISWKFVVVCLKYNWLYTIVLTFQTALSTFILITHLCIDFFFFF